MLRGGVEADVAQQQTPLGPLELLVEQFQSRIADQRLQARLATREQELANLDEVLHDVARLASLFGNRGRPARPVVEAVLAMVQAELAHRPVVDDPAVGQDVVAVPVEPAEDVLAFEGRSDACEGSGHLLGQLPVSLIVAALRLKDSVACLAFDEAIDRRPQRLEIVLLEVQEEVGGTQQVPTRPHVDRESVGQLEYGQRAFGRDAVTVKRLAHQSSDETFLERGRPASVVGVPVPRLEELVLLGGGRAELCHSRSTSRQVPGHASMPGRSQPHAATVTRGLSAPARVLQCEVTRGHVGVGQQISRWEAGVVLDVVLVDDAQAERLDDRSAQSRVHPGRMPGADQAHLARQVEVEVDDLAAVHPAGRVGDVTVRNPLFVGMTAVYF